MGTRSKHLFETAKKVLVGGVNSPVRSFSAVGGSPLFIQKAKGPYLYCEDNNRYIDYMLSWGPCILGHANPKVVKAIQKAATKGSSYGAPTVVETDLAVTVQKLMPSIEKLRFVNSGTEACMSAIRVARGATNRPYIVKFKGCYHGHADAFLVAAGSGALTLSKPDSKGVLTSMSESTLLCEYNNIAEIKEIFSSYGNQIAGVIIEPVAGNMGLIPAEKEFIHTLKDLCEKNKSILIFDEVMSGFRCHLGGAQALFNCKPDLTILGKVIGGGLPCGAYGGKKELMDLVTPLGPIYQAGTLSGNPLAMHAGLSTLTQLMENNTFNQAAENCQELCHQLQAALNKKKVPYYVLNKGTMFGLFFSNGPIKNLKDVQQSRVHEFPHFFNALLQKNIYWPPSAFETCFFSSTHLKTHIKKTVSAISKILN